jgi:hypothetical protein
MTVKELIKALGMYPGDLEVAIVSDGEVNQRSGVVDIVINDVDKVRLKEVYFESVQDKYFLATDDAFAVDVDVENRVVLFI